MKVFNRAVAILGGLFALVRSGVAVAGAVTLSADAGKVTSEALVTVQDGIYTLTITNNQIQAADMVFASVSNGSNTQGTPIIGRVTPGLNSVVIQVINQHPTAQALNGTVVVSFFVVHRTE